MSDYGPYGHGKMPFPWGKVFDLVTLIVAVLIVACFLVGIPAFLWDIRDAQWVMVGQNRTLIKQHQEESESLKTLKEQFEALRKDHEAQKADIGKLKSRLNKAEQALHDLQQVGNAEEPTDPNEGAAP